MRYNYDEIEDSLSIELRPGATVSRTVEVDDGRYVDLDAAGGPVKIEILSASRGFRVDDLIERFQLEEYKSSLDYLARKPLGSAERSNAILGAVERASHDPDFKARLDAARIKHRAVLDKLKDL